MSVTRRKIVIGSAATLSAAALGLPIVTLAQAPAAKLKISHQFPGGSLTEGDFRDRLCRRFAADVEKETKGALKFEVYPNSSLMKTIPQFAALRKGALDLSLYPISYAGGEVAETNIGLMPGLVTNYDQAYTWKNAEVGKLLTQIMAEKGIIIVSWVWQAGGVASRAAPLVQPEDAKGMKVRGGSREMDMILKEAGASVLTLPSNEIYAAMQTGAMDAGMTSSTSLISFRLEEVSKSLTTGRGRAYWFMLEPLLMSKQIFDALPKDQQAAIMAAGAAQEKFALESAKADDKAVADVYLKAGAKVYDLDEATVKKWQAIARETAWKDYGAKNENCAKLLAAAIKTL
jgi:TRAP-type C4-dicarboxylate transport system substrate-binding protein